MTQATAASGARDLAKGATALGVAMLVANAGNYLLNLVLGRLLTPAEFSDANLVVTLMLTVSSIAMALQLVCARFVALNDGSGDVGASAHIIAALNRVGFIAGAALAVIFIAGSVLWASLFHTESPWPFIILGASMPWCIAKSVGRGVLQGRLRFAPLAVTFIVEMVVRLVVAIVLVLLGFGVNGATIGLAVSFVAAWVAVRVLAPRQSHEPTVSVDYAQLRAYAAFVSVLLVGQIVINNSDVLIAKVFLSPYDAGIYSAVALVGRAVFFLAWSVATVVFPAVAKRGAAGTDTRSLLRGGILAVAAIGVACTVGAIALGGPVLGIVLGSAYADLSLPLSAYAAISTLFAIANLIASYDVSLARIGSSWVIVGGSAVQVVLLLIWHGDMWALIGAQGIAMGILVVAVSVWHATGARREKPVPIMEGSTP